MNLVKAPFPNRSPRSVTLPQRGSTTKRTGNAGCGRAEAWQHARPWTWRSTTNKSVLGNAGCGRAAEWQNARTRRGVSAHADTRSSRYWPTLLRRRSAPPPRDGALRARLNIASPVVRILCGVMGEGRTRADAAARGVLRPFERPGGMPMVPGEVRDTTHRRPDVAQGRCPARWRGGRVEHCSAERETRGRRKRA